MCQGSSQRAVLEVPTESFPNHSHSPPMSKMRTAATIKLCRGAWELQKLECVVQHQIRTRTQALALHREVGQSTATDCLLFHRHVRRGNSSYSRTRLRVYRLGNDGVGLPTRLCYINSDL